MTASKKMTAPTDMPAMAPALRYFAAGGTGSEALVAEPDASTGVLATKLLVPVVAETRVLDGTMEKDCTSSPTLLSESFLRGFRWAALLNY